MDILTYFQADHAHIEKMLNELILRYNRLSPAQIFEQAVRIFEAVRVHFDKQEVLLLGAIENIEGLQPIIKECLDDRRRILAEIEDAVNLHVDEADFNEKMKDVLKLIENHVRFSDTDLYVQLRKHAPAEVIQTANERLATAILS